MDSSKRPSFSLYIPTSTLAALLRAGYTTVQDPDTSNAEKLTHDLSIPFPPSQRKTQTQSRTAVLAQEASTVSSAPMQRISTRCAPLDKLLGGGLPRRHVLELSGPPGTPKGAIAVGIVKAFLKDTVDEEVLFLDMQNMVTVSTLRRAAGAGALGRVFHHVLQTLPELTLFVHALPALLEAHPKLGLMVLSSLQFPFQATASMKLAPPVKTAVLENIKQVLVRLTARGVTVVVTTQLKTTLLAADGSPATFDTGARAVMVPQLAPTYLPSAVSFRVMISPQERFAGVFRLLSAPEQAKQRSAVKEEAYNIPTMHLIPV